MILVFLFLYPSTQARLAQALQISYPFEVTRSRVFAAVVLIVATFSYCLLGVGFYFLHIHESLQQLIASAILSAGGAIVTSIALGSPQTLLFYLSLYLPLITLVTALPSMLIVYQRNGITKTG
ncbi:hypothetical protein PG987_011266 [Apiospora arundinis]